MHVGRPVSADFSQMRFWGAMQDLSNQHFRCDPYFSPILTQSSPLTLALLTPFQSSGSPLLQNVKLRDTEQKELVLWNLKWLWFCKHQNLFTGQTSCSVVSRLSTTMCPLSLSLSVRSRTCPHPLTSCLSVSASGMTGQGKLMKNTIYLCNITFIMLTNAKTRHDRTKARELNEAAAVCSTCSSSLSILTRSAPSRLHFSLACSQVNSSVEK